jgi:acetyl esterase/lipase
MVGRIALATGARALSFYYRLAPQHPFPTAIEDTVKMYRWLLDGGTKPSRIAVIGDSAGGGLTLSLLHHLRDNRIPLPACAVCISAWADLTLSGNSFKENKKNDHLFRRNVLRDCADNYLQGQDATNPSASPVLGDFSKLPPILFQVGGDEVLLNDSQTAVKKSKDAGTQAELSVWPDMVHDFQLWAMVLPDGRKAIREIGQFVKKHIP